MIKPGANGLAGGGGAGRALAAVAVLACLVTYGLVLNGPLLFDDIPNLTTNDLVQIDGAALDDWRVAALGTDSGYFYRPVSMLTFAVNHVLAGSFTALSLKATNLAIHLAIGALVYFFTLALLATPALPGSAVPLQQRRLVAVVAASLWLLHPIHVSTVLYVVQRMAQLSALFTLAGLLLFTRYRLRWAQCGAGTGEVLAALIWLGLLALLASLSKENGALLPWLITVVEVTLFRGIWCGQSQPRLVKFGWLLFALPLLLVGLVLLVSPEVLSGRFGNREFTMEDRLLTQARVLWQYISWLALPNIVDMGFFHDDIAISRSWWSPLTTVLSILAWILVLAGSLVWRKRNPLFAFAVLFYLVAHSMESSLLPLDMVFEHRNYLPSVGLAVLAAVGIFRLSVRFDGLRLTAVAGGLLCALLVLLAVRTQAWGDELTLARFNVVNHPLSARANFFYANALFKKLEQADALGLDEEERRALAVASRSYFERMHRVDQRDFAALVMLYQLDTLYFPGLVEKNDWLGTIQELAKTRPLKSSDRTALGALAGFSSTAAGASGRHQVDELLTYLVERYPKRMDLLAYRFRFLAAYGDDKRMVLQAMLERAARLNPNSRQAAAYLAQYYGNADLGNTYEAIREWLRRDRYRRELHIIKGIFDN
jgi:hypothetical protein